MKTVAIKPMIRLFDINKFIANFGKEVTYDMNNSKNRQIAKEKRKLKSYEEALVIYQKLWNLDNQEFDKWLGWEYADTLKKLGRIDEAIKICKEIYCRESQFKYNNDLLCWLLYERYIKHMSQESTSNDIHKMFEIAEFIIKNTSQDGKKQLMNLRCLRLLRFLKFKIIQAKY